MFETLENRNLFDAALPVHEFTMPALDATANQLTSTIDAEYSAPTGARPISPAQGHVATPAPSQS